LPPVEKINEVGCKPQGHTDKTFMTSVYENTSLGYWDRSTPECNMLFQMKENQRHAQGGTLFPGGIIHFKLVGNWHY